LETPLVVALDGPLARAELPRLCARVAAALGTSSGAGVECDVHAASPDVVTVEALARLRLLTKRHACAWSVRGSSPELRDLIDFLGLRAALGD
jgi:hypothetical protein